jgi:hypothetical protein
MQLFLIPLFALKLVLRLNEQHAVAVICAYLYQISKDSLIKILQSSSLKDKAHVVAPPLTHTHTHVQVFLFLSA